MSCTAPHVFTVEERALLWSILPKCYQEHLIEKIKGDGIVEVLNMPAMTDDDIPQLTTATISVRGLDMLHVPFDDLPLYINSDDFYQKAVIAIFILKQYTIAKGDTMKILSRADSVQEFLKGLKVRQVFGVSQAFNSAYIIHQAEILGIKITTMPKKSPEYKQYGEYVFKVANIGVPKVTRLYIPENLYLIERAKRLRKCAGYKCAPHSISPGEQLIVSATPDVLPTGRKIMHKKNLCLGCAQLDISSQIDRYTRFLNGIEHCVKEAI